MDNIVIDMVYKIRVNVPDVDAMETLYEHMGQWSLSLGDFAFASKPGSTYPGIMSIKPVTDWPWVCGFMKDLAHAGLKVGVEATCD